MIEDTGRARIDSAPGDSIVSTRRVLSLLSDAVVALSFWTAVALPALLTGLLYAGIETRAHAGAFLTLTVLEILALVVGRSHGRD